MPFELRGIGLFTTDAAESGRAKTRGCRPLDEISPR
jgi:hypothetical protein